MQNQSRNVPRIAPVRITALPAVIHSNLVVMAYYATHGITQPFSYLIAVAVIAFNLVGPPGGVAADAPEKEIQPVSDRLVEAG